jgi:hypothetical protein
VEIARLTNADVVSDKDTMGVENPKGRPNFGAASETAKEFLFLIGQWLCFFE